MQHAINDFMDNQKSGLTSSDEDYGPEEVSR